ncbi:MAG: BatD family protein [Prevotella sp.]|nr:BatD family protein [Candidatus Equicola stercoris]
MRRFVFIYISLLCAVSIHGAVLRGTAPQRVAVGERFQVAYSIAGHDASEMRMSAPDAFEVLIGPSVSRSSSFQMVNGKTSSNESTTFTYVLLANKAGTFTIPSARCMCNGQSVISNRITITVKGQQSSSNGNITPSTGRQGQADMRPSGSRVSGNDLFIRVSANKKRVHEQEPILLTYKVYTQVELTALDGKMPDLKNFHVQEVKLPQQKSLSEETYNGKRYKTVVWSRYVMFPQVTGALKIPSITFTGTVVQQNMNIDPLDAFFNGGAAYSEVKKKIVAPAIDIMVDALPERPKNFCGGVGVFDIKASLIKNEDGEIRSGMPFTIRVVITGTGNMKLIKEPTVDFPKDFERYDAKVKDNTTLTEDGVSGNIVYDFLAVPRHKGSFTIPPIELTYFDTSSESYKTVKTQAFNIDVKQGKELTEDEQESLKLLNKDIRFIKRDNVDNRKEDVFFGSVAYWIWITGLSVLFIILLIVFRNHAIEAANVAKQRGKKANKVAVKRLKKAKQIMDSRENPNDAAFYDEVMKALLGYAGDKLNMPVEDLTKENISDKFMSADIDAELISLFNGALNDCEFARFAPGDKQGNMNKTYDSAATAITSIEKGMRSVSNGNKKVGRQSVMRIFLMMVLFSAFGLMTLSAQTKAEADTAFVREDYKTAIRLYESLVKQGENAVLYYNLGNAYYREGNIPRAVLNYERAHLLDPGDEDIRFNLELVRTKTIDRIVPEGEMFFISWYRTMLNWTSVDGWANIGIVAFGLALALFLLYLMISNVWIRRIGFFGSIMMFAVFVLSNIFAYHQSDMLENRNDAVVMSAAASVKSTPAQNGTDLFVIHEGTKVRVIDDSMTDWKEVRLADGKRGWVMKKNIERI